MRYASHWAWLGSSLPGIFPLLLLTWKVAPALACGNAVVVKPSEETPATATLLAESMKEAGFPDGVYNVVHGFGPNSAGEFLTRHPDVNAVTFTGESSTGAEIMKTVAASVKPVSFELGGRMPQLFSTTATSKKPFAASATPFFSIPDKSACAQSAFMCDANIFDRFVHALKQRS